MRQPLEDRCITISRSKFSIEYPASFMLVASMNPCPCGFYNHPEKDCVCSSGVVQKYLNRISGPLLDRIDIHIEVVPVPFEKLSELRPAESSENVRYRVIKARKVQLERFNNHDGIHCNAQLTPALMREHCQISPEGNQLLKNAMEKIGLSAAHTIAFRRYQGPLPIWMKVRTSCRITWQKLSITGAWTGTVGRGEVGGGGTRTRDRGQGEGTRDEGQGTRDEDQFGGGSTSAETIFQAPA